MDVGVRVTMKISDYWLFSDLFCVLPTFIYFSLFNLLKQLKFIINLRLLTFTVLVFNF